MQFIANSLTVRLLGRSKTRVLDGTAEKAVHEGLAKFLRIEQIIYEVPLESNVLEEGERSHFRIWFPEDPASKDIRANKIAWPSSHCPPEAQTLPPTGEYGIGNTIEYSVEAGVIDETSGDEITVSIPITFSSAREDILNSSLFSGC